MTAWMPIASAPRDVPILVYGGPNAIMAVVTISELAGRLWFDFVGVGGYEVETDFDFEGDSPTHWQPLPEPPVAEGEG